MKTIQKCDENHSEIAETAAGPAYENASRNREKQAKFLRINLEN